MLPVTGDSSQQAPSINVKVRRFWTITAVPEAISTRGIGWSISSMVILSSPEMTLVNTCMPGWSCIGMEEPGGNAIRHMEMAGSFKTSKN